MHRAQSDDASVEVGRVSSQDPRAGHRLMFGHAVTPGVGALVAASYAALQGGVMPDAELIGRLIEEAAQSPDWLPGHLPVFNLWGPSCT
nr:hypothetical protein GCM10020063_046200 [Dactylosporangium thailandense]